VNPERSSQNHCTKRVFLHIKTYAYSVTFVSQSVTTVPFVRAFSPHALVAGLGSKVSHGGTVATEESLNRQYFFYRELAGKQTSVWQTGIF
jgi:hypothetical protein